MTDENEKKTKSENLGNCKLRFLLENLWVLCIFFFLHSTKWQSVLEELIGAFKLLSMHLVIIISGYEVDFRLKVSP